MDTDRIMGVALEQAGLAAVPADSGIHVPGEGLKKALFGVDIDVAELLFARDSGYDVVVAHHPLGSGSSPHFTEVMWRQVEQMVEEGVAEPVARAAVAQRVGSRHRLRHMANYNRVTDTARLIGLPLLNIHLPPDIVSRRYVKRLVAENVSEETTVAGLVEVLNAIPEMARSLVKPEQWIGEPDNPVGRVAVAMAGGTNGGYPVYSTYFEAGVATILSMHIDEGDYQRLRAESPPGCNLVVTGHMPSDSIGINRLIWRLEDEGLACQRTSGIIDVPRSQNGV